MKILSWKTRWLGSPSKRALIKAIISCYSPDIVILTETKLKSTTKFIIKYLWNQLSTKWIMENLTFNLGGILIMWDDQRHKIANHLVGLHSPSVNLITNNTIDQWLTTIYDPA